jgi:hypothetical protein
MIFFREKCAHKILYFKLVFTSFKIYKSFLVLVIISNVNAFLESNNINLHHKSADFFYIFYFTLIYINFIM